MLLSDFFTLVDKIQSNLKKNKRTLHLNIELKPRKFEIKRRSRRAPTWDEEHFDKLLALVDEQSKRRTIVLASLSSRRLDRLRKRMKARSLSHPTNLGATEIVAFRVFGGRLTKVAYETSHLLAGKRLVNKVCKAGGSFYVFIIGGRGIDKKKHLKKRLFRLLDMGVDGIMTDYPEKVGELIREWKRNA